VRRPVQSGKEVARACRSDTSIMMALKKNSTRLRSA
jgi:hypothetical protein